MKKSSTKTNPSPLVEKGVKIMKKEKIFDAKEFKDIKEMIYNSAYKYNEQIAFVIKHKIKNKKMLSVL